MFDHRNQGGGRGEAIASENIAAIRKALAALGLVVAEVDRDLRYVWIDNPHPDFEPAAVIGKRDDELIASTDAAEIMALKRSVLESGSATSRRISFQRSDGTWEYNISAVPVREPNGAVVGVVTAAVITSGRPR